MDVYATGFRANNGMAVGPNGTLHWISTETLASESGMNEPLT